MPRTVDEGFRDFLTKLTASESETSSAKSHRESIETKLEQDFGLYRLFRIGSFGNGTSISGHSDVDYLASLKDKFYGSSSSYSLSKVRDSLDARFPRTGVRVNCPAVFVPFGTSKSENHEIVPGDNAGKEGDFIVYRIPDCADGWMKVSPEAHIHYVNEVNKKLSSKVKPLIRFIKAWKFFRDVPISSFYLEMRVAKYASTEPAIIYDIDVKSVLKMLWDNQLAAIKDPMGVSGYISACKTDALRKDALSKLERALSRATKAREAKEEGNISEAFDWWRMVYDDKFPTYHY
jgi:hypothetical protein